MTAARVVLLGGAPMSGKSTVANELARRLTWDIVCTDDLGIAARAVTCAASYPDFHGHIAADYLTYYEQRTVDQLWSAALAAHRALWPAVAAVVAARAAWGRSAVVEGWALLPGMVAELGLAGVAAAWLVADERLLKSRLRADSSFWAGAKDPELLIARFVARSIRYQQLVVAEAAATNALLVPVTGNEETTDLVEALMSGPARGLRLPRSSRRS